MMKLLTDPDTLGTLVCVLFVILIVVSIIAVITRRDYVRLRYLATKGYKAKEVWSGEPGYVYIAPDDKDTYDLSDAYKRQRLIDERIRLNVPEDAEPAYRLGDFAK